MSNPDIISIDGFPLPYEFEEQVVGVYVNSVKFFTDTFWNIGARLIISGRGLYNQSAATLELLSMGEAAEEIFTFYSLVEVRVHEDGSYCNNSKPAANLCTEKHTFTAYFNGSRITRLDYHGYTIIETKPNTAGLY